MTETATDELGFDILESTSGDRVKVNGRGFDVGRSIHLRDKDSDDLTDDIFGIQMSRDGYLYKIYVHPASVDSDDWISEIFLWEGRSLDEEVEQFERLESSGNDGVKRERYKELWSAEN